MTTEKALYKRTMVISASVLFVSLAFAKPSFTMRIDDNHSTDDWFRVADIFERRGVKVSFAVISSALTEEQGRCLKNLADRGHLIMDHTPNHGLFWATYHDRAAFERVKTKPFVQEADEKTMRVLFKCEVDANHPRNRRVRASVRNGRLTFSDPRENKKVYCSFAGFPGRDGVFGLGPRGKEFEVRDIWCRPLSKKFDMDEGEVVIYAREATQPGDDVVRELAGITRERFAHFGLPPAKIWVMPGGWCPGIGSNRLERIYGREFGYVGGNSGLDNARNGDSRWTTGYDKMVFFDQGADYTPEGLVDAIQKSLAAGKHHVRLSHMWFTSLPGGKEEWFAKTDKFAQLLADRKIPTQTMLESLDDRFATTNSGVAGSCGGNAPIRMQNIAHRGMWDKDVPQNTVEAIRRAYESGATWVETDFHHTKAGQMVCIHAETELERYTGSKKRIVDLTPDDLAVLNLGERDGLPVKYRIPLLDQVLAVVPSNGVLQAEIKGYSPEYADIFDKAVAAAGLSDRNIVVSSFKYGALRDFKSRYPKYRTVWLVAIPGGKAFQAGYWIAKCREAGFDELCPGCGTTRGTMTRADADALRVAGLGFRLYGVNSREDLEQAKKLGAAGFTCNYWRKAFDWAAEIGGVELAR